jgi:hypothetical protein
MDIPNPIHIIPFNQIPFFPSQDTQRQPWIMNGSWWTHLHMGSGHMEREKEKEGASEERG